MDLSEMNSILDLLQKEWHSIILYLPRVVVAIVIVFLSYILGKNFANITLIFLRRSSISNIHYAFFRIAAVSLVVFMGLVLAFNILGLERIAMSMIASGGATAIILGFAFREIGENFLAGLFLAFNRPFNIGDSIKTEEIEGQVESLELRYTHIRTDDGRDVYVPSSQLFNKPVTNFTKDGLRRISFSVGIDYSNDAKAACALLSQTVEDIHGVLADPPPGAFISTLSPQYVELKVFYWVDVFDQTISILSIRNDVIDHCRKALLDNGYIVSSETTSNLAVLIKENIT